MAKRDEWAPFGALLWRIAEKEIYPISHSWTAAHRAAWALMLEALENEDWIARTTSPATYSFQHGEQEIPLGDGATIHPYFWEKLSEAERNEEPLVGLTLLGDSWAERKPNDGFDLFIRNRASGDIKGTIDHVQVRIPEGKLAAGRPKSSGRPKGSSSLMGQDRPIVEKARAYMEATGATAYAAAKMFGHEMPGSAGEARKIERLNDTLLGHRTLD
ncbi:hypothetical protein [Porphyrobacter sp. CACIAM 03H1]|uniref:hypothetical protein n=1 Tax=Porphyrobacter sp. CACIAM 03H1 TaxID=2003315 RepID=UPI000B5A5281|nr:hypothetical protein [Porphyrobacter sp. CACIAM 03H1]ASJ90668.1 hypothetical protein CBR61_06835 [Porphyrobacter sp. CACIAM 03H1]